MRLLLPAVAIVTLLLANSAHGSGPGGSLLFRIKPDGRIAVVLTNADDYLTSLAVESLGGHLGPGHDEALDFVELPSELGGGRIPLVAPFVPSENIFGGQISVLDVFVVNNSHTAVLGFLGSQLGIRPLTFVDTSILYDLEVNPDFCADLTVETAALAHQPSPQCANYGDCNGDGVVDIRDADCMSVHELTYFLAGNGTTLGDVDGVGGVDFADFLKISTNFGVSQAAYTDGDLDKDGSVGFADFLLLSANFGQGADFFSGGGTAPVPEPKSSILFCVSAGIALASRARRKQTCRSRYGNTQLWR